MKVNKSLLAVLSMFLILLLFVSSASASDVNEIRDVLSVDESVNLENNETSILSTNNNDVESNENILRENTGSYAELANLITKKQKAGEIQITLDKDCIYKYDSGNTIEIFTHGFKVNGNGATIDMAGSTIQAFMITDSNVIINNLTIKNVKFDGGGGAIYWNGANGIVSDCTFTDNTATLFGGAIYWNGANGIVSDCNFTDNTAMDGGAIYWYDGANGTVSDCNFINNSADYGGAIRWHDGANGTVSDCNFTDNTATWFGGSIYWHDGANGIVSNCNFTDNTAELGGAIYWNGANGIVSDCNFTDNTANWHGGAFYWNGVNGNVSDCNFTGNTATKCGGSIYWKNVVNGIVSNCTFTNNTASSRGGAISIVNSVSVNNCALVNNIASTGSEIYIENGNPNLNYNWWGSNNPNWANLIETEEDETYVLSVYAILNVTADPNQIDTSEQSTITTKFVWNSTNTDATNSLPKRNVKLSSNGTLTETEGTVGLTLEFYATGDGIYYVNATVDNQELRVNVKVNPLIPTNIIVNTTSLDLTVGDNVTINATLNPSEAGNLIFTSNDTNIIIVDANGVVTAVGDGNAIITVSFPGNGQYAPAENKTVTVTVSDKPIPRKDLNISASAEPITVGENATIIVTGFENSTGDVTARIEGGLLSTTIVNGTATFTVPGIRSSTTAYINYEGDDNYNPANTSVNITVIPKSDVVIVAENVTKYYHGSERFVANIYDSELNPMVNKSVKITINGVTYTKITDANGTVSIGINLGSGTYDVTTTVDNTTVKSSVTVLSTLTGKDITKYYGNATQYSVKVFDTTGKTVGAGEVVTFNINGRFYNRTTDENGIATLNINLPQEEYVITAINPVTGEMHANNITVLPVLDAKDITMKYLDGTQFVATLVDGQGNPYKDQFIKFNINGILYNRFTDSNGQAALNIRLPPGEYIITSSFNGCNIANKITVTGVL